MSYRLRITKMEPNPDYAEQVKAYEDGRRYGQMQIGVGNDYPRTEREAKTLDAEITEAEWEIIKRGLVQFWATTEAPQP